jgi:hypothetical protein
LGHIDARRTAIFFSLCKTPVEFSFFWTRLLEGKFMKAKLIKKDSPLQEQLRHTRKTRKPRGKKSNAARSPFEAPREWLKKRGENTPSAREAFAALFSKRDPQSA